MPKSKGTEVVKGAAVVSDKSGDEMSVDFGGDDEDMGVEKVAAVEETNPTFHCSPSGGSGASGEEQWQKGWWCSRSSGWDDS